MRPRVLLLTVLGLGTAFTLVVLSVPSVRFAYRSPETHVALETAEGVIGGLAVALVYGRFVRSALARHLLIACGLALLALSNLVLSVVPAALAGERATAVGTWAPAVARLAGAAVLALGAHGGGELVQRPTRTVAVAATTLGAALLTIVGTVHVLADRLPTAVEVHLPAATSEGPSLDGHPAVIILQAAGVLLFALATWGFLRLAERDRDELFAWFAAGTALAGLARVHYVLHPSLFTEYVYTGDLLRLAAYVLYLVGGMRELAAYWQGARDAAVVEDRRRMARDLHDGLAQELAFIAGRARRLGEDERLRPIATAAERALDEARAAIAALTRQVDEPLDVAIDRAARDVAGRFDIEVSLDLDRNVRLAPPTTEALCRVVRESLSNAARHGRARLVHVELVPGPPVRITIRDDGVGFDPDAPRRPGSHGIVSMSERVAALGGTLTLRAASGAGATVEVVLP